MTEELKQKAIENVCKRNPLVAKEWFTDAFKKYDKGERVDYLRDYEIAEYESYIAEAIELQEIMKKDLVSELKELISYSTSPSCTKGMELFIKRIEDWEFIK